MVLLSVREKEIADLYAGGDTSHNIAKQLFIAPSTVRSHVSAIYRKLELSSKLELKSRLDEDRAFVNPLVDQAGIISELALSVEKGIARERALSAVLSIISRTESDLESVIPSILGCVIELCDADAGTLVSYRQHGRFCASFTKGITQEFQDWHDETGEFYASPQTALGRLEAQRAVVNVADLQSDGICRTDDPLRHATEVLGNVRSLIAIPMLAGDELVGAFTIFRLQVRPFSEDVTRLASIFADQCVIAIKNAQMISALRKAANPDD